MKKLLAMGGVLLICGLAGVGCQNTAEGAKEDTANNTAAVNEGAQKAAAAADKSLDKAGQAIKTGSENAGAALGITPKVKTAITADAQLNNTANEINVDSTKDTVTLKGHVISDEMKQRATQITEKTLKDANATQKVENDLTVTK